MIKGLRGATIWSEDLRNLLPFYRDVLGLAVGLETEGFVVLGEPSAPALALGTHSEVRGQNADPARHMVGLDTDDIDAEWVRLKAAGVEFVEPPTDYGTLRIATLKDPEGNFLQLLQPLRPHGARDGRATTAGRSAALVERFEAKVSAARAMLAELSDADWRKITEAERWPVGVTAHHVAGVLEPIADMIGALVAGRVPGTLTSAVIDEMNARHAKEHAGCSKVETMALLEQGAAVAAAVVRGLSDEQLARSGRVLADAPPMTAEQLVTGGLIAHLDEHVGSIRKTVGR